MDKTKIYVSSEEYLLSTQMIYRSTTDDHLRINLTRDTGIECTRRLIKVTQKYADQFAAAFAHWYSENLHIYADGGAELALEDFKKIHS